LIDANVLDRWPIADAAIARAKPFTSRLRRFSDASEPNWGRFWPDLVTFSQN
jgi:hypothetical protein